MRLVSIVQVVLANIVLLALYFAVSQDFSWRIDYWHSLGFTPTMTYSILSFVLSSSSSGTRIPGLLTFDWSQFLLVILVLIDGSSILAAILDRRKSEPSTPATPSLPA